MVMDNARILDEDDGLLKKAADPKELEGEALDRVTGGFPISKVFINEDTNNDR